MPKRTLSQKIGSKGEKLASIALGNLGWIVRTQGEDFGIDLEAELSEPNPTGQFLKCQVKAFQGVAKPKSVRLSNGFLRYVYECRIPVVLLLVEVDSGAAWFCWLQGCIEENRLQKAIYASESSTAIQMKWLAPLNSESHSVLKEIALGIHPLSRAAYVRDLVRYALMTHDHELVDATTKLLWRYSKEITYFPAGPVVDEALYLGNAIWATIEGNAVSQLLYVLARAYGDHFSKEQISRLVLRGESYSRTGINALGLMYDQFPEHMNSLELEEQFSTHPDWRVAYFCALRRRHSGVPVSSLMSGRYDCSIGAYDVDPTISDRGLNAWANRGDCAILDYALEKRVP
jgi:hypothetical protein